jgi:hypothetical protein
MMFRKVPSRRALVTQPIGGLRAGRFTLVARLTQNGGSATASAPATGSAAPHRVVGEHGRNNARDSHRGRQVVFEVSERRACSVIGQHRSTQRETSKDDGDERRLF